MIVAGQSWQWQSYKLYTLSLGEKDLISNRSSVCTSSCNDLAIDFGEMKGIAILYEVLPVHAAYPFTYI